MSWLLLLCRAECKLFFFSKSALTNWEEEWENTSSLSSVFHKAFISLCNSYTRFPFTVLDILSFCF